MKIKKILRIIILIMILIIPFRVEAKDYKIMLSFFSNGGTVSSGNVEVISDVVFMKDSTKADITYSSNQTISHINSLDGTNTFTLKKGNSPQTKEKEWYAINYMNEKKVYFNNSKKYTVKDIIKKLSINTSYNEESGNAIEIYMQANYEKGISVSKVSLNSSSIKIKAGKTAKLKATITPSNATDKSFKWSSENTSIATVDSKGVVTGVKQGTTNIVATTTDGGKVAKCKITVEGSKTTSKKKVIIKYNTNKGKLAGKHDKRITESNGKILLDKSETIQIYNSTTKDDLVNYNNPSWINITRNGYIAKKGAEWNTKPDGTGKSFNHSNNNYKGSDFCDASKKDCNVTLYVNWVEKKYTPETTKSEMKIIAIDYKNPNCGDSVLLESKGNYLLMDTSSKHSEEVFNYLKNNKIKNLDVYISHYHGDHLNGLSKIMNNKSLFNVKTIYFPEPTSSTRTTYNAYKDAAARLGIKFVTLTAGSTFKFGDATGKVIYHNKGEKTIENDRSLVTIITCGGVRYFTAGDISNNTEKVLLNSNINVQADIMKLSHHGVYALQEKEETGLHANTLAFIKKVNPKYVFYQYNHTGSQDYKGWKRYGDSEKYFALKNVVKDNNKKVEYWNYVYPAVQNVQSLNRAIYSTRYNGNIEFRIKNNHIENIYVERNKKRIKFNYINKGKNKVMFYRVFDVNNQSNYTIYDYKRDITNFKYSSGYEKVIEQNNASKINGNKLEYNIYYE